MVTQLQPDVRAYLHGGEVIKRYIRVEEVAHEYGFSVEETEYIAKAASSLYKLTRIHLVKKERFDEFMKHIYKVPGTNKQIIKKFARIGEASIIYSIGRHRFIELARAAGATYKINEGTGGTVLVNLEIFDNYMEQFRQPVRPLKEVLKEPGRSGKYPEAFLREYEGYIHTDAYSGYNAVSGVKRCLCYTHLRRAFVDALPPDQKKKERLIREKPLLEAFWSWAEKSAIGELPKSKLSKAFHYALNNREGFWNYLEDGNCSISNSLAENCIRPFVIGRKNWLFSGSPKGAEASAGIYTLFYLTLTAKA